MIIMELCTDPHFLQVFYILKVTFKIVLILYKYGKIRLPFYVKGDTIPVMNKSIKGE